jgi:F0F1-type ATP synthase membrane subunit b/b'
VSGLVRSQQNDASSLLEVLRNSELFEQRLTQLRDTEKQAQEVIALAGPASEITQIREQLREDEAKREELMSNAKAQAESILSKATEDAKSIVDGAEADAESIRDSVQKTLDAANSKLSEAQAEAQKTGKLNSDFEMAKQACHAREEALNARLLELEEERQLLADERKKLAGVRDQIAALLG